MTKASAIHTYRLIPSTISLGIASILSLVLGLASTMIITRHFSREVFGLYTLSLVIVYFLSQISNFGLDLSISRFIAGARDEASKEHFVNTAVIMRVSTIFLTVLLAWFGKPLIMMLFGNSLLPSILIYVPLLYAVDSFQNLLKSILQGCFLFPRIGISDLITSSMNFLLLLVLVYLIRGNIILLMLIRAFSSFLACVFAFFSIPIRKRLSFQIEAFKKLIKFGYPFQIKDIFGFISSRIDTLVVAALLGPVDIAVYEVARRIPDSLVRLYEPFRSVYYPFLTKRYVVEDQRRASKLLNDSTRFIAFLTLFGTAIAFIFGKEIIRLLFSEKYLPSAPVFMILMINLSLALIANLMGYTLVAVGEPNKTMIINIFNAVASTLGTILFIPLYGVSGASAGNLAGTALACLPTIYFLRKKIDLKNMAYLRPVILFCVWSFLVQVINPSSLLLKAGFLIVYVLASFFLSIVTRADIMILLEGTGITTFGPLRKFLSGIPKP
jgi:O-antigen/teichoic acid export membrane protein